MAGLGSDPVTSKVLGALFGGSLDPYSYWGDSRVMDYYNKNSDSIFKEATDGQYFDPVAGSLVGGKDLKQTTLARMQADPSTAHLFDPTPAPNPTPSATAGGQLTPEQKAASQAPVDLAGENKNLTIAGGSADAASTVADDGKKKRSPTGLASSLGINV